MAISPNRQTTFVPTGSPVGVTDQSTIRLNDSGFLYASDHHNDRLLVFDLGTRSVTGSVSGKLDFPADIVTGKQEDWYQAPSRHGSQPRRAGMTEATLRHRTGFFGLAIWPKTECRSCRRFRTAPWSGFVLIKVNVILTGIRVNAQLRNTHSTRDCTCHATAFPYLKIGDMT